MNYEILKNLTINNKSGNLLDKKPNQKIDYILSLIDLTKYKIYDKNGIISIYPVNFDEKKHFITVSSHIDTVYKNCFCEIGDSYLVGTFDNSLTNFVLLEILKLNKNNQVVFFLTDNEEIHDSTILKSDLFTNKKFKYNICLDVTPYCYYTHFATIENDYFGLSRELKKENEVAYINPYQSMNDETKELMANNKKGFSLCITCCFDNDRCHSENGGKVSKINLEKYMTLVLKQVNKFH